MSSFGLRPFFLGAGFFGFEPIKIRMCESVARNRAGAYSESTNDKSPEGRHILRGLPNDTTKAPKIYPGGRVMVKSGGRENPTDGADLPHHPLLSIFPAMSEPEFAAFREDIRMQGLRERVWTFRGLLVDGRHRQRACRELCVECPTREWRGKESGLLSFMVSLNLRRRHLDESQRALVAARLADMRQGERTDLEPSANLPKVPKVSQGEAAELLNVSDRTLRSARQVLEQGTPELVAAVERGEMAVSVAAHVARLTPPEQQQMLSGGRAEQTILKAAQAIRDRKLPSTVGMSARIQFDPDRYIRLVKGGKYQARPYSEGERYSLGLFETKAQARKAIQDFWWGRVPSRGRFVRRAKTRQGPRFFVVVPVRVGEWFETYEAASAAAERWIRATWGKAADLVLKRR